MLANVDSYTSMLTNGDSYGPLINQGRSLLLVSVDTFGPVLAGVASYGSNFPL